MDPNALLTPLSDDELGSSAKRHPITRHRGLSRAARRSRQQALLADLGRLVASGEGSAELMVWVVPRIIHACDATDCHISELLPSGTDLLLRATSGVNDNITRAVVALAADALAARALQTAQPVVINSLVPAYAPDQPPLVPPGARSGVIIPVSLPDSPLRVLSVYSTRHSAFTRSDIHFLQSIAAMLAGIARQQLCQREIETVIGLSRTLRTAATCAEMPSIILAQVRSLMPCTGEAILLNRADGTINVAQGDGLWARATGTILADNLGLSGKVMHEQTPYLGLADARAVDFTPDASLEQAHAVAGIPLLFNASAVGVLWVASPAVITHDEIRLLRGIADIAASALYRADLSEQTTHLFREHQQLSEKLRRAERHLNGIVESASDLVISADINGRIVTWNRAAERISGFTRDHAIGRRLSDYCAPSDHITMDNLLKEFVTSPHARQVDELPLVGAAGHIIPISWRFSPLQNKLGEITGVVAVGRDLLDQRRLESQLFQAAKMTSLGIMASGIGHELRNPLGIISANAQIAQNHLDDPNLVDTCLTRVHSATRRAALIIDSLLTFAQPGHEVKHPLSVNQVLAATLTLLEHQIHQRHIVFTTKLDPLLLPVIGNPALLQQVFTNLILNACQAMTDGGALSIESQMHDANMVEVCVRDQGCGISAEALSQIFDPFFTTRPVGQGTGLGLAISYSIVQQHGGQIEVHSQPDEGSTFIVRLPAAETPHTSPGSKSNDQDPHHRR